MWYVGVFFAGVILDEIFGVRLFNKIKQELVGVEVRLSTQIALALKKL
jgi:hypothetical protein